LALLQTLIFSLVAAALVFGPTRRSANQSYTHGGGQISDGSAPRTAEQLAGLQPYADAGILREYCQPGDPICAPHSDNKDMSKHLNYFELYGDEAAEWVIDLAKKAESGDKTSGARSMLHQTISHPIANVFILIFVLFLV
jgi:acetylxylan esterase